MAETQCEHFWLIKWQDGREVGECCLCNATRVYPDCLPQLSIQEKRALRARVYSYSGDYEYPHQGKLKGREQ